VLAEALRGRLPAVRGSGEEVRVEMPDDLWAAEVLQRYHELDNVPRRSGPPCAGV